jgi:hypothetical protein
VFTFRSRGERKLLTVIDIEVDLGFSLLSLSHSVDVRWSRARLVLKDAFLELTTATILVHVYNIRPMSEWIPVCESDGTYTTHNHACWNMASSMVDIWRAAMRGTGTPSDICWLARCTGISLSRISAMSFACWSFVWLCTSRSCVLTSRSVPAHSQLSSPQIHG